MEQASERMMRLSQRLPEDLSDSPFFSERSKLKREISTYLDLTVSSPLKTGQAFPLEEVLAEAVPKFSVWNPDANGCFDARKAVSDYFAERGGNFSPDDIQLFSSTSEAYSVLFKTLCDSGDAILTPMPGYPLLDSLASLENIKTAPYFLKRASGKWELDADSLYTFPPRTKIFLAVSPHNPTGHVFSKAEWETVVDFASREELSIVVDEVFGDFIYDGSERPWNWDSRNVPVFFLGGFSKSVGSPQLKLGWMAYRSGRLGCSLKSAIEYVADAYLSVSSPAFSLAAPMLKKSLSYEKRIETRVRENLKILRERFSSKSIVPDVQGGWYAALHFDGLDDEELTLRLLRKAKVLVQPGFFFDFDGDGWIVLSLLQDSKIFAEAVERIYLEVAV